MSFDLRPYQQQLLSDCRAAWAAGARVVMSVLPTGGGKTIVAAHEMHEEPGLSAFVAHRSELVAQCALALAREGVAHRVVGPTSLVKSVVAQQMRELGRSWYSPNARAAVCGVDTLVSPGRREQLAPWVAQLRTVVGDEGHHWLKKNKWGRAVAMLPEGCRVMLPTATPTRSDGMGLGARHDGLVDALVLGPSKRWLIDDGYLCDYRRSDGSLAVYCPPVAIDRDALPVSDTTGEFLPLPAAKAVKGSTIVGDAVEHYRRFIPGKQAILFAVDVEAAINHARAFNEAGVPAEAVDGNTDQGLRDAVVRRFREGKLRVLVNVDLFGEGFDAPACDAVIFCRPTQSFPVYSQQWGRGDRVLYAPGCALDTREGRLEARARGPKPHMTVIDHVGNVVAHGGPPDLPRRWTLERREKGSRGSRPDDEQPIRVCGQCSRPYERFRASCPHPHPFESPPALCGWAPVPTGRGGPELVDGDLFQVDEAWLAAMSRERAGVDRDDNEFRAMMRAAGHHNGAVVGATKAHALRRDAQGALRHSIAVWAGQQAALGRSDDEAMRVFYLKFGTDTLSAQSLGCPDALALADRVNMEIGRCPSRGL